MMFLLLVSAAADPAVLIDKCAAAVRTGRTYENPAEYCPDVKVNRDLLWTGVGPTPECVEALAAGRSLLAGSDLPPVMLEGVRRNFESRIGSCKQSTSPQEPLPRAKSQRLWD